MLRLLSRSVSARLARSALVWQPRLAQYSHDQAGSRRLLSASTAVQWRSREERRLALHGNAPESSQGRAPRRAPEPAQTRKTRTRDREALGVFSTSQAEPRRTSSRPHFLKPHKEPVEDVSLRKVGHNAEKAAKRKETSEKIKKSLAAVESLPPLTDEVISDIYQDLLTYDAAPPSPTQRKQLQLEGAADDPGRPSLQAPGLSLSSPSSMPWKELYKLAVGPDSPGLERVRELKERLADRIAAPSESDADAASGGLAAMLRKLSKGEVPKGDAPAQQTQAETPASASQPETRMRPHSSDRREALDILGQLLPSPRAAPDPKDGTQESATRRGKSPAARKLYTGIATPQEWAALAMGAAADGNLSDLTGAFELMLQSSAPIPEDLLCATTKLLSRDQRLIPIFHRYLQSRSITIPLSVHHEIIAGRLQFGGADSKQAIVSCERHLRELEEAQMPALPETYAAVLRAIFGRRKISHSLVNGARERAWNLYAHSRLVAHPVPTTEIFDTMIYGCSLDDKVSPERALDMFVEMLELGVKPSYETYSGLIRTCARARDPVFYFEALRQLKELLERGFQPERDIFNSLLTGAKPRGDLARAKWITANMLDVGCKTGQRNLLPDETTFHNLFMTYATYSPPRTTHQNQVSQAPAGSEPISARQREESPAPPQTGGETSDSRHQSKTYSLSLESQDTIDTISGPPTTKSSNLPAQQYDNLFDPSIPTSKAEVLEQVRQVFAAILSSRGEDPSLLYGEERQGGRPATLPSQILAPQVVAALSNPDWDVGISLLNSYLCVLSAHSTLKATIAFFKSAYERPGIPLTGSTWETLFDKCNQPTRARGYAVDTCRELFREWSDWLARDANIQKLDVNRHVETIWSCYIGVETRAGNIPQAQQLLEDFVQRFPASNIVSWAQAASQKTNRTGPSYLVQMSSFLYPETSDASSPLAAGQQRRVGRSSGSASSRHTTRKPRDVPPHMNSLYIAPFFRALKEEEDTAGLKRFTEVIAAYDKALQKAHQIFIDAERGTASTEVKETRKRLISDPVAQQHAQVDAPPFETARLERTNQEAL